MQHLRAKEALMMEIDRGVNEGWYYFYTIFKIEGSENVELIVNPMENVEFKKAFYERTYDRNLRNKFVEGIQIISFGLTNCLRELNDFDEEFKGMQK